MNVSSPKSDKSFDWELVEEEGFEIVSFEDRIAESNIDRNFHQLLIDIHQAAAGAATDRSEAGDFPEDLKALFGQEEFYNIPYLDLAQKEIAQIRADDLTHSCIRFSNAKEGHSGFIYSVDRQKIQILSGPAQTAANWRLTELVQQEPITNTESHPSLRILEEIFGLETFKTMPILNLSERDITEIKIEEFGSNRALRLENQNGHIGVALLINETIETYFGPSASSQEWLHYQINSKKLEKTKTHIESLKSQISSRQRGQARTNLVHKKNEAEIRLEAQLTPFRICLEEKKEEIKALTSDLL